MGNPVLKRSEPLQHPEQSGERRLLVELAGGFVVVAEQEHDGVRTTRRQIAAHKRADAELAVSAYNQRLRQLLAAGWRGPYGHHPRPLEGLELPAGD